MLDFVEFLCDTLFQGLYEGMTGEPGKRLGKLIAAARDRKKLSQADLARAIGYGKPEANRSYVAAWERGEACPPMGRVGRLCQVLGLPLENVVHLALMHKHGELEPEVVTSMVREETARYGVAGQDAEIEKLVRDAKILKAKDPAEFRWLLDTVKRIMARLER
jgi:transcriptional regulator with XRE-family HTH domain